MLAIFIDSVFSLHSHLPNILLLFSVPSFFSSGKLGPVFGLSVVHLSASSAAEIRREELAKWYLMPEGQEGQIDSANSAQWGRLKKGEIIRAKKVYIIYIYI